MNRKFRKIYLCVVVTIGLGIGCGILDPSTPLEVSVEGEGSGIVLSHETGIECGEDCYEEYFSGTVVVLQAIPGENAAFVRWSAACDPISGMPDTTCAITIEQETKITAVFDKRAPKTSAWMTPLVWTYLAEVPSDSDVTIDYIAGLEVVGDIGDEFVLITRNRGADCGEGTPVAVWKMTHRDEGRADSPVWRVGSLDQIHNIRGTLLQSSTGTLLTGSGWCKARPPYYSDDGGETWFPANRGAEFPPNSTFSLVEFNGQVYAGTGYQPHPGEIYRWLGNGEWERVHSVGYVRDVVSTMVEYRGQLFVGSGGHFNNQCEGTVPVLVSRDGDNYLATAGIPSCSQVLQLFVLRDKLYAVASQDGNPDDKRLFGWSDASDRWEELGQLGLHWSGLPKIISFRGSLWTYGTRDVGGEPAVYRLDVIGARWQHVADTIADVKTITIHDDSMYLGTDADESGTAHVYKIR